MPEIAALAIVGLEYVVVVLEAPEASEGPTEFEAVTVKE